MSNQSTNNQYETKQNISNVSIGDSNVVTFNQTQILQVSVAEIKTREFRATSPYKGLKKFEPEDKDIFFGRDQFLTGIVNQLQQTNLILLLGASGSGKSSVVRAGLIPWLSQKWGTKLVKLTFTPDIDPFESFYASLLSKYKQSAVQMAREAETDTLTEVVNRLKQPDDYWFILIDQFEELFTTTQPEKRNKFISSLVQLSKINVSNVKIVATMRADFLDRFSPYPALVKATDNHRPIIAEMQQDELRLAIEQPAAHHGVVFETGLVEEIIKDVQGQAGYLPLLQYTLNLLWETEVKTGSINDRTLNLNTYRMLGGVRGALQEHIDKIYGAFSQPEQLATQKIFLKLVDIGGDSESSSDWKPVRRRANRFEFSEELEQSVLRKLIDENLLVSNAPQETLHDRLTTAPVSTVEIAHEILLTSWTTLNTWIEENRQAIALFNRLNDDVAHWQTLKNDDELWSGSKLAKVVELRQNPALNPALGKFSEKTAEFIDASVKRRDRQRRRSIIVLSAFSTVVSLFAILAGIQYYRAETGQISALNQSSEARSIANKAKFDALLSALDAAKRYQSLILSNTNPQLQTEIQAQLGQAVYWTRERNRLQGHQSIVQSVSFSPDGQMIATASYDNTIKLWQADGKLIKTLLGHKKPVMSVSFSPKGDMLASASQDSTVKLWDRNGNLIKTIEAHKSWLLSVKFSPDGKTIAAGSNDYTAKLWRIDGTKINPINPLNGHSSWVMQVLFHPKTNQIVTTSGDNTIKLWTQNGKLLQTLTGHTDTVMSAAFSPDEKILATASLDKTVKLWSSDGKLIKSLSHPEKLYSVSFSKDGQIASGSVDGNVRLWTQDGKLLDTWAAHDGAIPSLTFSPDGQTLATTGNDNITKLWQVHRRWLTVLNGHQDAATGVNFRPDGKQVVSAGKGDLLYFWSPKGNLLFTRKTNQGSVYGMSFSPDGQTIASAGGDYTIRLWDANGKELRILRGHQDRVNNVSFSPDGQTIASASDDQTAKLWSLDGKQQKTLQGHKGRVLGVSFSPDGKIIATSGDDQTVKLWGVDGKELRTLRRHTDRVWNVKFSPDGKTIASASADGTIKLWSLEEKLIKTLKGHTAAVLDVSFSPDGKAMIASASSDKTIKLWRTGGTLITTLRGHQSEVNAVNFSPDGKFLASAGKDRLVLLWNVSDLSLPRLLKQGCQQIHDYLKTHPEVSQNFCN
ncbi:WD40 repeat domain-containing protein [Aulosira sp. FACHB-615]|uniref:nSTAND1 domain-containing NTPase n=1 Tax=Aulosira sp. FACHB-615 TaxID=2692777 RepID=UPI00168828FD|nr:WD40 repeat domain-containing protein [Aulosira sp. FACHB-615]MBD2490469.1 WD40 repeat domain-containing protein [Aulosira sp. FACHB-615]